MSFNLYRSFLFDSLAACFTIFFCHPFSPIPFRSVFFPDLSSLFFYWGVCFNFFSEIDIVSFSLPTNWIGALGARNMHVGYCLLCNVFVSYSWNPLWWVCSHWIEIYTHWTFFPLLFFFVLLSKCLHSAGKCDRKEKENADEPNRRRWTWQIWK